MLDFFFTTLYQPLYNVLMFLVWLIPGHYVGLAIIVLTVLIRVALLPSSLKAARFQVKNAELQPKVNKIRREIKDQQEQTKAIMALYKEEGHSPFGSCLPLLIQMPILIVMYQVFRGGLNTDGLTALYSFMPRPEMLNTDFLGFDLTVADPWILPILAGLLQFGLSWMMKPKVDPNQPVDNKDPMAMMSKQMLFLPSVITIFFGRTMPAALVLYWIVTTLFGIGQQWYVNKEIKTEGPSSKDSKSSKGQVASSKEEVERGKDPKSSKGQGTSSKAQVASSKAENPVAPKKDDFMTRMLNRRLDKQEKKANVNVQVRTKKK